MNTTSFDSVSVRELFGEKPELHLLKNINASEKEAHKVVESGEFIRDTHNHGNTNSSLKSTYEGARKVADKLAERVTLGERSERLFGEHIREAFAAFRPLFRKK
jgi:hypothetical protein